MIEFIITTDPEDAPDDCGMYCDPYCPCGGVFRPMLDPTFCPMCGEIIPPDDLSGPYCECEVWTQQDDKEPE